MEQEEKSERKLERIAKGFANHRRIEMMRVLERAPDLSLLHVCQRLGVGYKTGAEHLRRLVLAGLVSKRNRGRWVVHRLSKLGAVVLTFLRTLE